jgi:demethylspheroidene O-methyltransferase
MMTSGSTGADRSIAPTATSARFTDQWLTVRDRLLSSPRFRRWAASFAFTRPIARRHTRSLFDLCGGFVYSQILFACVQLDLFDILAEGPQSRTDLSKRLSLSPDATVRLLAAAVSLKLVSHRGEDRFGLGPLGAAMVNNEAVAAMVRHHSILYNDLTDPVALLRGEPADTELSRYWAYAKSPNPGDLSAERVGDYTALMAASQTLVADEILDAYPIRHHRRLLDVGGGNGTFLTAAALRAPDLGLMLFDLPAVAEQARRRLASTPFADRLQVSGGDFFADTLPSGADLISLIRVLHDHDDDAALSLLRNIRRILPNDGALVIAEPMSGTPGAEPIGDAYFGFYLLAMRSGRPRTAEHIESLLIRAGFARSRRIASSTPLMVRMIAAFP